MKINALLAATLAALIAASVASAEFTGLFIDLKGTTMVPGPGFTAINVYACFDSPTDRALSVTGAKLSSFGGAQFYQNPFGGDTEPNPILFPFFPELQWDTFVTIGLKEQGPPGTPVTSLEPGSSMTSTGFTGGWFTDGDAPQGLGVPIVGQPGFYVLLMQLTIQNPNATDGAGGTFTLAWKTSTSGAQFSEVSFECLCPDPAPGTLPLLLMGGLLRSRRRR